MVPLQAPLYMTGDELLFFLRLWRFIYADQSWRINDAPTISNPCFFSTEKIFASLRDLDLEYVVMDIHVPITYKLLDNLFHPFIESNKTQLCTTSLNVSPLLDFMIQESMISNGTVAQVRKFMKAIADGLITPERVWQESRTKPMRA